MGVGSPFAGHTAQGAGIRWRDPPVHAAPLRALEPAHAALGPAPELSIGAGAVAGARERALEGLHIAAGVPAAKGLVAEAGLGDRNGNGGGGHGKRNGRAGAGHLFGASSRRRAYGVS